MAPRIAIPLPHSLDTEYAQRAIPQYERAVELAGGRPVRIPLDQSSSEVCKIVATCDAVLLPGSKADVDPSRFGAKRSRKTAAADSARDAVDNLLLEDAFKNRKPVLGICYGLQSLNVFLGGSLVQHIPDLFRWKLRKKVNHAAGAKVAIAHQVTIEPNSALAKIMGNGEGSRSENGKELVLPANSSHHQSAEKIGGGLRIVAHCTEDGIVEALEGTSPDHFVIAVQWHPERSVDEDAASPAIFRALVEATNDFRK